ncbi:hypothetical protein ELI17_37390 [Rhizobium ruizarguesonis]|uniref:hypothetical protein n=1 Tax=Rhizobium ruizarguesonis TaxID=2081791 RepID=UPI001031EFEA|nr:hypothetical protein [Rhizobium ruizarguesonis]TAW39044.1 hypothetical protein ELI17_37390 [Rhizobium ruizarguesonis]
MALIAAKLSGWASYFDLDADVDPESVKDECAVYAAHDKEYLAKLEYISPRQVRASPAEEIDAGEFYVQLEGLKSTDGAALSSGSMNFGPGRVGYT